MQIDVDQNLVTIARQILAEQRNEAEWSDVESDDMFQLGRWCGGFDANEKTFLFSYWDENQTEHWCQFDLDQVKQITDGNLIRLESTRPE